LRRRHTPAPRGLRLPRSALAHKRNSSHDRAPAASSAPLKAQSARGRTSLWGRGAVPLIRKGVGLLLPLTSHSTANDLHAPLRALTAPELPSEGGGPLVLPASRRDYATDATACIGRTSIC